MRRWILGLLLAACAMPTLADPAPPATAAAPDAAVPAQPPKKLEGVVVEGKRRQPTPKCGAKDAVCIAAVITELKTRYPEQLKVWCFRQKMDEMRNALNAEAFAGPNNPGGDANYSIAQAKVIRTVCTTTK